MTNKLTLIALLILSCTACKNSNSDTAVYSILVSKIDKIVQEDYFNGKTADDLTNVQSLTKSIMSILIGIAIDQDHIQSEINGNVLGLARFKTRFLLVFR